MTVTSRTYNILSFLVFRKKNKLTYMNKKKNEKKKKKKKWANEIKMKERICQDIVLIDFHIVKIICIWRVIPQSLYTYNTFFF